jgi:hypothetical protein
MDFGGASAKLILNHLSGTETINQDVDGTDYATPTLGNLNLQRTTDYAQSSAELRLSGTGVGERLNWVGGLYYLTEDGAQPTLNLRTLAETRLAIDNRSKAVFAHGDFNVTDRFSLRSRSARSTP